MKADAFFLCKEAHDANDRILYDKKTGGLWYDADGSGSHAHFCAHVGARK